MTALDQRNHQFLTALWLRPRATPLVAAAHPWWRRLIWVLAGGVVMLAALLTPALANPEEVSSPPPSATRSEQALAVHPTAPTPSLTPAPATPAPPTATPPVLTALLPARDSAAGSASTWLFLPLVVRTEKSPSLIATPPAAVSPSISGGKAAAVTKQAATLSATSSALAATSSAIGAVPMAANKGAADAAAHRLYLSTILRPLTMSNLASLPSPAALSPSARGVDATRTAHRLADGALLLPLVANSAAQALTSPTDQPPLDAVQTPISAPTVAILTPVLSTPVLSTPDLPTPVLSTPVTPTPAGQQPSPAQQQLQALLDQVNQLMASGALPTTQGQPLLDQVRGVMQLPIVRQGHAPPNPLPGQLRPWQRQMQQISDQVHNLVGSGVLTAAQGQPLLDQAQAIIQTLGGA